MYRSCLYLSPNRFNNKQKNPHMYVFSLTLYDIRDGTSESVPSPSPPSSHTCTHRYICTRHPNWYSVSNSTLTYLRVYNNRDDTSEPSTSPPSSLTHSHRYIDTRNPNWYSVPNSVRLTYLSVYDRRDGVSDSKQGLTWLSQSLKFYVLLLI